MAGGNPITASYSVTVNSFMASGGDNQTITTQGTDRVVGPVDLAAFVGHIQPSPQPLNSTIEGRLRRIN